MKTKKRTYLPDYGFIRLPNRSGNITEGLRAYDLEPGCLAQFTTHTSTICVSFDELLKLFVF